MKGIAAPEQSWDRRARTTRSGTQVRARAAVAMMAAAVRAAAGQACRDRRMTRVLSFIMPSAGIGARLRLVVRCGSGLAAFRLMTVPFGVVCGAAALQS